MKKWTLRVLIALVVMACMGLLMVKIVSGTGEPQQKGLEQTFSKIFGGEARFGKLLTFNLFPQFTVDINALEISGIHGTGQARADEFRVGFGAIDLITKNRKIEKFFLKNLYMGDGVYFPVALDLAEAGIFAGDAKDTGKFAFSGTFGDMPLKGEVAMVMEDGYQRKFHFADENPFVINIGSIQLSGQYVPYGGNGALVRGLGFFAATSKGRQTCDIAQDKTFAGDVFFKDTLAEFTKVNSATGFDDLCARLKK